MQAYSPFNPVGAQHNYPSVFAAFRTIVKADGLKGLARGVDAAMLRTAMGSSVQLPAYNLAKSYLGQWGVTDGVGQFLMASFFSGLCVCAVMQPAGEFSAMSYRGSGREGLTFDLSTDTALTRMYNQSPNAIGPDGKPRGLLCACLLTRTKRYFALTLFSPLADKNPIDCLYKTWKTEGVRGWYKGTTAHLARIAPHTVSRFASLIPFSGEADLPALASLPALHGNRSSPSPPTTSSRASTSLTRRARSQF